MSEEPFALGETKSPNGPDATLPATREEPSVPAFFGQGKQASILEGLEGFSAGELGLQPPQLKIIQRIDRADQVGRPGEWRLGNETFTHVDVVLLRAQKGCRLDEGEGRDSKCVCASSNGIHPHPTVISPRSKLCGQNHCDYAKWETGPDKKRIPPPCAEFRAFMAVIPLMQNKPVWIVTTKTGTRAAKEFIKQVAQLGAENVVSHLCELNIRLTTEPKTSPGLTWHVPVFTILPEKNTADTGGFLFRRMADIFKEAEIEFLPRLAVSTEDAEAEVEEDLSPAAEVMEDGTPGDEVPF